MTYQHRVRLENVQLEIEIEIAPEKMKEKTTEKKTEKSFEIRSLIQRATLKWNPMERVETEKHGGYAFEDVIEIEESLSGFALATLDECLNVV